jgi:hypothetical protein
MKLRGLIPKVCIHVSVSDFYIFPRSVSLFCFNVFADRLWEYINRSQIHECRNWEPGRAVSFSGNIFSSFPYGAFAVLSKSSQI